MATPYPANKPKRPNRLKQVKLYPVLPYVPYVKRQKGGSMKGGLLSQPVLYHDVVHYSTTFVPGGTTVPRNSNTWRDVGFSAARSFVSNKEWKKLIAKGQDATFAYQANGGFVKPIQYIGRTNGPTNWSESYGSVAGLVLTNIRDNTTLKDIALARLKRKLNGYVGQAQLAAPLAESKEIHHLVRQINGLTEEMLKAMLALKGTKGKSVLKLFGNLWLGFGFGVNPLLKDIEAAANSILDYQTRQDRRVRVSGTASQDYSSSGTSSLADIATGVVGNVIAGAHHKQAVRIVAGIDLTIRSDASYGVTDHLGLQVTDIPSAIWELIPFSWVVDYVATVSPWVDDMFYTLPGVCKYCSQSEKYQNEVVWNLKVIPSAGYSSAIRGQPGGSRYYSFTRTPLTKLPSRQLRIKSVDEIAKYGLTKIMNLGSVLAGHLTTPNLKFRGDGGWGLFKHL